MIKHLHAVSVTEEIPRLLICYDNQSPHHNV